MSVSYVITVRAGCQLILIMPMSSETARVVTMEPLLPENRVTILSLRVIAIIAIPRITGIPIYFRINRLDILEIIRAI